MAPRPPRVPKRPRVIIPAAMRAPARKAPPKLTRPPVSPTPQAGSAPAARAAAPPAGLVLPPWAQQYVDTIDAQKANAQGYIAGTVMPWLASTNQNLADANRAAQEGFTSMLGASQQVSNVAGALKTPSVTTGGAGSYDPNAYLGQAQARLASAMGGVRFAEGTQQAAYRTAVPYNLATAANSSLANYAGTVGPKYDMQKADYLAKVGQFIAQQDEQRRQWAIERTDRERQARFDRQLAVQAYGLDTIKAQASADNAQANLTRASTPKGLGGPDTGPAPAGYAWVQRADGGWDLNPDKSYVAPGTGDAKRDKRLDPVALQKDHTIWKGKGVPSNTTGRFVKGNDGNWWVSTSPAGSSTTKPPSAKDAIKWATTWWDGKTSGIGGGGADIPSMKEKALGVSTTAGARALIKRMADVLKGTYGLTDGQIAGMLNSYFGSLKSRKGIDFGKELDTFATWMK